jgi:tetratricopeptide (TPR) repeat protein
MHPLQQRVEAALRLGQTRRAIFYAEKLLAIDDSRSHLLQYARLHFLAGDPAFGAAILSQRDDGTDLEIRYLSALYSLEAGDLPRTRLLLGGQPEQALEAGCADTQLLSALHFLHGRLADRDGNAHLAVVHYARALDADPENIEAQEALFDLRLISPQEQRVVVAELAASYAHCASPLPWLLPYYSLCCAAVPANSIDEVHKFNYPAILRQLDAAGLLASRDTLIATAVAHPYRATNYVLAASSGLRLLAAAPECLRVVPAVAASLAALAGSTMIDAPQHRAALESIAASLRRRAPHHFEPWLAAGLANLVSRDEHTAHRMFDRALALNPRSIEALLARTASQPTLVQLRFARTSLALATRLVTGAPEPYVAMARVAAAQGSYSLARQYLLEAEAIAGPVPAILLDQARVATALSDFPAAAVLVERSLASLGVSDPLRMASPEVAALARQLDAPMSLASATVAPPLATSQCLADCFLLLGHAYRRAERVADAAASYDRCLAIRPRCGSALAGLGMCWHAAGDLGEATKAYDAALGAEFGTGPQAVAAHEMVRQLLDLALQETVVS